MRRVFRWVGIINLIIVIIMAIYGAYGLKTTVSVKIFFVYWSVFFLLLMSAIVLAMLDALTTMAQFRKEHERLRESIRSHLMENTDTDSQTKQN